MTNKYILKTLNLFQAPSSLLEALEQHLASLEGKKTKELNADTRWTSSFPASYQVFLDMYDHARLKVLRIRVILNCVFQSVHPVQRRLVSLLHRHVLQPHGREGEAAGPGGGAGQTAGSQGNRFCALIPAHP